MNIESGYNGADTELPMHFSIEDDEEANWGKSEAIERRLRDAGFFEEQSLEHQELPKFKGRHLISRDTKIHGGVYVGEDAREAIVVDEKYGQLLPIYEELYRRRIIASKQEGGSFKHGLLEEVWKIVKEKIPYDPEAVQSLIAESHLKNDRKVAIDSFINRRGGVCRHQALLGAYLLEKLGRDGHIRGRVSIDRNFVPGKGGHAWIRYTNSQGVVWIIDPAQNYIGRLDDIKAGRWFYERPEDIKAH